MLLSLRNSALHDVQLTRLISTEAGLEAPADVGTASRDLYTYKTVAAVELGN